MSRTAPPSESLARLLAELAGLGPFFQVATHTAESVASAPWRAMSELTGYPECMAGRVALVRRLLATNGRQAARAELRAQLRVAASLTQLGLVARLLAPALAAAVIGGRVLDLDLASTRWQPVLGGPFPLSVRMPVPGAVEAVEHDCERLAAAVAARVVDGPIRELVEATGPFSVPARTLWGNVASAVHGAATMIGSGHAAQADPARADRAWAVSLALLGRPPLRDTSTTTVDGGFRRRSCCLVYRAAPDASGPVCGDCVLAGPPRPRRRR